MARTVSLGAHRLPPAPDAPRKERIQRSREMLAHALTQGTTVAVVGSGCSIPLGYPSWRGFATELIDRCLAATGSTSRTLVAETHHERLLRFQVRLTSTEPVPSQALMFMIGVCKRLFADSRAQEDPYRRYLAERFRLEQPAFEVEHNPHRDLLRLPIERFVTTNYDCEIERALHNERHVTFEELGICTRGTSRATPGLSFTQRHESCHQLALFALARVSEELPEAKNMVFHCHGRFDDLDTIIATELDYQRWYLAEETEAAPAFLQTFDLLFNSNPILFVGFGLEDEDLLRPLRRIAATTPERRQLRPLFALVSEAAEGADWDRHEQLFERYGLNVLPFVSPASADSAERSRVLCAELARLEEERLAWRDAWHEKPMLRTVSVQTQRPHPYRHYCIDSRDHETLGTQRVEELLDTLEEEALAGLHVIGLVGSGGTGKSWHAMRLLEAMERKTKVFAGFFFWSSYYADDSLTGLDRLLGYLDPQGDRTVSRLTRLRERVQKGRYLVVLDGVERLLRTTEDPEIGKSSEPVTSFLRIFAEPSSQSTLVLTSRLWPRELDANAPDIKKHGLERLRTDDLSGVEPFRWFDRTALSALCSLLEGHAYALFLAGRLLGRGARSDAEERLLHLRRALSSALPGHRLGTMIDLALEALDRETHDLARALLERLAVFMSPVTRETLLLCLELAAEQRPDQDKSVPPTAEVISALLDAGVLFKVASGPAEHDPPAFTAHPTVRTYLFEQADEVGREVLPNFTLAGFTSSRAAVHPGSPAAIRIVRELFDRLHERAVSELAAGRREVAGELCRSLFGIVRSRMESNTVARWTTYPDYLRFSLRLADLARSLSLDRWSFREPHELAEIEQPTAPLYADEIAFVYNDVGLTLCAEGHMQDTLAVWEEGFEINRILEGTAEVPIYSLQSQLHLGHTFLELGKLAIAEHYLEAATKTNRKVDDHDYAGRILGYQALISFYRGHLEQADTLYDKAFRELEEAGGNPRAQSFFLTHRAKLAIIRRDLGKADELLRSSHALAASIHAEDLLAYARTVRGRLYREQKSFTDANHEYHAALAQARRLGIRRLEAEILAGLCRVALSLGDNALARQRAMTALGLANELGLGLRQSLCLFLLGVATWRAGQPKLGAAYLRLAKRLGDAQQHWLHNREAEKYLQELGEEEQSR